MKNWFKIRKKIIMQPTIQSILAGLQANVTALAAYVANLAPSGNVPQNIASALVAFNAAVTQFQTDLAANPVAVGATPASVLTSDLATATTALAALVAAVASPSSP